MCSNIFCYLTFHHRTLLYNITAHPPWAVLGMSICQHRDQDTVKALKAAVASEELFKGQKNKSLPQMMVKHGGSKDDIEA